MDCFVPQWFHLVDPFIILIQFTISKTYVFFAVSKDIYRESENEIGLRAEKTRGKLQCCFIY